MNVFLFWVPPLAGAIIGYVTNMVAIKMLFRPLKEIRFFRFRLPFTPGILPRERKKLADSIGRMVEQELLTPGVLRERLARSDVRENAKGALGAYTNEMLARPLSYWLDDRSDEIPLSGIIKDFINSNVFDSFLEEIVKNRINRNPAGEEDNFGSWLKYRFRDFSARLITPAARDLIKNGLAGEIKNQAGESSYRLAMESIAEKYPGITTREFLSLGEPKKRLLDSWLAEKAVDSLDNNIENALESVNVKVLVSDRINSLDMIRVEKIVLDVMAGQLKWINVFGAILGALIGFLEVFVSLFTR
jgi:uncharacterized membrane protein YheB (UPF0754 family)